MSTAVFCHSCGSKLQLSGQAFCQNCGTQQLNDQLVTDSSESSSAEAILKLLKESESVVFQADAEDPFYTSVHPFMYVYSMADEGYDTLTEYIEEMWGDIEGAHCDNCKVEFTDLNNWILDDGSNVFGIFCVPCISSTLKERTLFTESIPSSDYSSWTRLYSRPEAVCWIRDHYESLAFVTGSSNEMPDCWACGSTGTKVNLAQPHWEVTLGYGSSNSMPLPVCDDCISACRILIPRSD
jgi:hypothetical protein